MVEGVVRYKTADGEIFETLEEAAKHDLHLDVFHALLDLANIDRRRNMYGHEGQLAKKCYDAAYTLAQAIAERNPEAAKNLIT